jgi:hypothetical protein
MSDKSSQTPSASRPGSDSKSSSPASTTTASSAASSGDTDDESSKDTELQVLSRLNKKILELSPESRHRVVEWLYSRHRAK